MINSKEGRAQMRPADEQKLQRAVAALKSGDKPTAMEIFKEALRENPSLEDAWVGLSLCLENTDQKRSCLQRALAINPNHTYARSALARLEPAQRLNTLSQPPKVHKIEPQGRANKGIGNQIFTIFLGLMLIAICCIGGLALMEELQKSMSQVNEPVAQQPSNQNVVKDRYRFYEFYSDD